MSATVGAIILIGRALFSVFFARSGIGHVRGHRASGDYARSARFPVPYVAGWPAGVWLLTASVSITLGIWPDIGALMIAVFVVLAAAWFHRFWEIEDPGQRRMQSQNFFRNVALLGASLAMLGFFVSAGDGLRFALTGPIFGF